MCASLLSRIIQTLAGLWRWVTASDQPTRLGEERRNANLLISLLLTLVPYGIVITIAQILINPAKSSITPGQPIFADGDIIALLGAVISWFITVYYAYRGYYRAASMIAVVTAIVAIFAGVMTDGDLEDLPQLVLPLLIAAMLFPLRTSVIMMSVCLLGLLSLPAFSSVITAADLVTRPFSFCYICIILIYLAFRHRDRQEAERQSELAEKEARYRNLFESAYEGLVIHRRGVILDVNHEMEEMIGQNRTHLVGGPLIGLFADEVRKYLLDRLLEEIDEPYATLGLHKDGHTFFWEIINRIESVEGEIVQVLAVRDVTEKRHADEALRVAQKFESLGALAGGIAHDFNNLLSSVMGQTSIAQEKIGEAHPAQQNLVKAMKSARLAADLTRQLLAYAGRDHVERTQVNLNALVDESRPLFEVLSPRRDWLHFQLAAQLPLIYASDTQMRQVLMNLVINASEAIDRNSGKVAVQTTVVTVDSEFATGRFLGHLPISPGQYACLEVIDNGSGIDERTLSRLFDPFFTAKPTGHGLGLASTLGIIRSHKGAVRVMSTVGRGTIFTILLPALPVEQSAIAPPMPPKQQSPKQQPPNNQQSKKHDCAHGTTILLIDDDLSVRDTVVDMLSHLQVLAAGDGYEGLRLFETHRDTIAAVLLDVRMPTIGGVETFAMLQKADPNVRVIFCSGYTETNTVQQLVEQKQAFFLPKPFSYDTLMTTLRQVAPEVAHP